MGIYAVVRDADGSVVNFAEWDGEARWNPGPGLHVRPAKDSETIGPDPASLARQAIKTNLITTLADLRAFTTLPNPTPGQTIQAAQVMARALVRLIRWALNETDSDT